MFTTSLKVHHFERHSFQMDSTTRAPLQRAVAMRVLQPHLQPGRPRPPQQELHGGGAEVQNNTTPDFLKAPPGFVESATRFQHLIVKTTTAAFNLTPALSELATLHRGREPGAPRRGQQAPGGKPAQA